MLFDNNKKSVNAQILTNGEMSFLESSQAK